MERRELLKMIMAATGVALVGSYSALAYDPVPKVSWQDTDFSASDVALMDEIGETIIPKTDTPGAKDAKVGQTMAVIAADCFDLDELKLFKEGLKDIEASAKQDYNKGFMALTKSQKHELISRLDEEAKRRYWEDIAEDEKREYHAFTLIKQQVLFCFFTSREAATQVLRYASIPGSYNGLCGVTPTFSE